MKDKYGFMLKVGDVVETPNGILGVVYRFSTTGNVVVKSNGNLEIWTSEGLVKSAEQFAPAEPSDTPEWFNEGEFWKSQFEAANRDARHYLQEFIEKTRLLSDAMGLLSVAAPFMASKLKPSSDTKFEWAENMETLLNELESPE